MTSCDLGAGYDFVALKSFEEVLIGPVEDVYAQVDQVVFSAFWFCLFCSQQVLTSQIVQ